MSDVSVKSWEADHIDFVKTKEGYENEFKPSTQRDPTRDLLFAEVNGNVVAFAEISLLLDAGDGIMRDPELHFDGERLLFAWRKTRRRMGTKHQHATATKNYQIYEYNLRTKALRQLTASTTYGASLPIKNSMRLTVEA